MHCIFCNLSRCTGTGRQTTIDGTCMAREDTNMDTGIQKYRAFIMAADLGSLAAAAYRLDYSISSVSRMVADLESDCGLQLLERSRSGVHLTSNGERLLPLARSIVDECDGFKETADEIAGVETGTVRIGTFSSTATHWLPSIVKSFRAEHPGLDYELLLGDYSEIEGWLEDGRVDLGFVRLPARKTLATEFIARDELVAVMPRNHPLACAERFPIAAFADEPFMALEHGIDSEVADLFGSNGVDVHATFTTWEDHAIMAMVEAGLGLGILPSLSMHRCAYDIASAPLDVPAYRDIAIAWRAGRTPWPAASRFLECLRATSDSWVSGDL